MLAVCDKDPMWHAQAMEIIHVTAGRWLKADGPVESSNLCLHLHFNFAQCVPGSNPDVDADAI